MSPNGTKHEFNLSSDEEKRRPFQTAALVDVVFILLIFFVSVSTVKESSMDLDLAEVDQTSPETPEVEVDPLIVEISADRVIAVNGVPTSEEELYEQIVATKKQLGEKPRVRIQADQEARHREMMAVISSLKRAGLTDVEFGVKER